MKGRVRNGPAFVYMLGCRYLNKRFLVLLFALKNQDLKSFDIKTIHAIM